MSNVLKAIINIQKKPIRELKSNYSGRNTINNIGEALEAYIQDAFADTISESDERVRSQKIRGVFSYLGNQNNPPDIMLRGGDAIEVKKIQNKDSTIALNSSYPKHKLQSDDSKITEACKNCENWDIKDIIYAVGVTNDENLQHLCLVYGDCYAASRETYSQIGKTIKDGVTKIPDIEFSKTKELGRVNRVDPLGITNLRIRGMWHIDNPLKVFGDNREVEDKYTFSLTCIMRKTKYQSFSEADINDITKNENLSVTDIKIKDPNNPAKLIDATLITMDVL